jgi:hypothetical protein
VAVQLLSSTAAAINLKHGITVQKLETGQCPHIEVNTASSVAAHLLHITTAYEISVSDVKGDSAMSPSNGDLDAVPEATQPRICQSFYNASANVVFISSDKVIFRLEDFYLKATRWVKVVLFHRLVRRF